MCRDLHIAFRPITVQLVDTGKVVRVDVAKRVIGRSSLTPEIAMHSESLAFIFKFPYGFKALSINGAFEELRQGAFDKLRKTFAIDNLNNLGYSFTLGLLFRLNVVLLVMGRLMKTSRKWKAGKPAASEPVRARAA